MKYQEENEMQGGGQENSGGGKRNKRKRQMESDNQESGEMNDEQNQEEEEGGTDWAAEGEKQIGEVKKMAQKVMNYIEESTQNIDKETLGKYAAVGVLLLAGTRKSGIIGTLACSIAAGVITKYIVENSFSQSQDGEEVEENEPEAATA